MTLHTYNVPAKYHFTNLMVSEIQARQDFTGQCPYAKVKGQIKVTP